MRQQYRKEEEEEKEKSEASTRKVAIVLWRVVVGAEKNKWGVERGVMNQGVIERSVKNGVRVLRDKKEFEESNTFVQADVMGLEKCQGWQKVITCLHP